MKFLPATLAYLLQLRHTRRNVIVLLRLVLLLAGLILLFSIAFQFLMAREGQQHSWLSGFYWTIVTMSTLGFGDITFNGDVGRAFAVVVIFTGVLFLLVLLPFTFIQFFYAPWMQAQAEMRAPRELPADTSGHVIITRFDDVATALIERLRFYGREYVVLVPELPRALELHDLGIRVALGAVDDLETYRNVRADSAALVVATADDYLNTNIAFTVRELTSKPPIVAVARDPDSVDILTLAGATHVVQLADMLGRSLARRTLGGELRANIIGRFDELVIAEAPVMGTPFASRSLLSSRIRESTGLTVVGIWDRGAFLVPNADTIIEPTAVLVLAGSEAQLERFDELLVIYNVSDAPVVIIGGGRVGRAAGRELEERNVPYRIVERNAAMVRDDERYILGSAADLDVLERAGIREAPTTIVTTADDPTNIFLTIYCRRLRPDMQIIARSNLDRNVSTLHRAGADFVMSYASMGANAMFNVLERDDLLMLAEGLDVFRYPAPRGLAGKTLASSLIRETTGCSVIAMESNGQTTITPKPEMVIPDGGEMILIGTTECEQKFVDRFGGGVLPRGRKRQVRRQRQTR